jgi:ribonuclease-3
MAGEARRRRLRVLLARADAKTVNVTAIDAALVHGSAVREGLAARSNERLEFVGDAVLGFIVARWLFERYPDANEGELALRKSSLVSDLALAATAERLDLESLLVLGQGLAKMPSSRRRSVLADAFEAFLAALYLEAGLEKVAVFVVREHLIEHERVSPSIDDPKTVLQEWTQRRYGVVPEYRERPEGPHHDRTFFAEVAVNDEMLAEGSGPSKKAAQRAAAAGALERLRKKYDDLAPRELSAPRGANGGAA